MLALTKEQDIETLEAKVGQLEHVRQKQANKIAGLKEEVEVKAQELDEKGSSASKTVQALSNELRSAKSALDATTKSHKQVNIFRTSRNIERIITINHIIMEYCSVNTITLNDGCCS